MAEVNNLMNFADYFKSITLLEARRSNIPKDTVLGVLEKYKDREDIFVSFRNKIIEKDKKGKEYHYDPGIGINPRNNYGTPTGIYGYVLKPMWDQFERGSLPFAMDRPLLYVYTPKEGVGVARSSTFTQEDFRTVCLKIQKMYNMSTEDIEHIMEGIEDKYQQNPLQRMWSLTRQIAVNNYNRLNKTLATDDRHVNYWSILLVKLGYPVIVDDEGRGIIHSNEPTQSVVFGSKFVNKLEKIENKNWSEVGGNTFEKIKDRIKTAIINGSNFKNMLKFIPAAKMDDSLAFSVFSLCTTNSMLHKLDWDICSMLHFKERRAAPLPNLSKYNYNNDSNVPRELINYYEKSLGVEDEYQARYNALVLLLLYSAYKERVIFPVFLRAVFTFLNPDLTINNVLTLDSAHFMNKFHTFVDDIVLKTEDRKRNLEVFYDHVIDYITSEEKPVDMPGLAAMLMESAMNIKEPGLVSDDFWTRIVLVMDQRPSKHDVGGTIRSILETSYMNISSWDKVYPPILNEYMESYFNSNSFDARKNATEILNSKGLLMHLNFMKTLEVFVPSLFHETNHNDAGYIVGLLKHHPKKEEGLKFVIEELKDPTLVHRFGNSLRVFKAFKEKGQEVIEFVFGLPDAHKFPVVDDIVSGCIRHFAEDERTFELAKILKFIPKDIFLHWLDRHSETLVKITKKPTVLNLFPPPDIEETEYEVPREIFSQTSSSYTFERAIDIFAEFNSKWRKALLKGIGSKERLIFTAYSAPGWMRITDMLHLTDELLDKHLDVNEIKQRIYDDILKSEKFKELMDNQVIKLMTMYKGTLLRDGYLYLGNTGVIDGVNLRKVIPKDIPLVDLKGNIRDFDEGFLTKDGMQATCITMNDYAKLFGDIPAEVNELIKKEKEKFIKNIGDRYLAYAGRFNHNGEDLIPVGFRNERLILYRFGLTDDELFGVFRQPDGSYLPEIASGDAVDDIVFVRESVFNHLVGEPDEMFKAVAQQNKKGEQWTNDVTLNKALSTIRWYRLNPNDSLPPSDSDEPYVPIQKEWITKLGLVKDDLAYSMDISPNYIRQSKWIEIFNYDVRGFNHEDHIMPSKEHYIKVAQNIPERLKLSLGGLMKENVYIGKPENGINLAKEFNAPVWSFNPDTDTWNVDYFGKDPYNDYAIDRKIWEKIIGQKAPPPPPHPSADLIKEHMKEFIEFARHPLTDKGMHGKMWWKDYRMVYIGRGDGFTPNLSEALAISPSHIHEMDDDGYWDDGYAVGYSGYGCFYAIPETVWVEKFGKAVPLTEAEWNLLAPPKQPLVSDEDKNDPDYQKFSKLIDDHLDDNDKI